MEVEAEATLYKSYTRSSQVFLERVETGKHFNHPRAKHRGRSPKLFQFHLQQDGMETSSPYDSPSLREAAFPPES